MLDSNVDKETLEVALDMVSGRVLREKVNHNHVFNRLLEEILLG
jgi:hypothetical protein